MLTLRTSFPVASEPLPVPRLCLSGKAPPRDTTVDLSHIEVVPNMNLWPLFHNGVAAGLRISPNAANIDSTWIVYNKPKVCSNFLLGFFKNVIVFAYCMSSRSKYYVDASYIIKFTIGPFTFYTSFKYGLYDF